jgi:general secretion pathway protein L
LGVEGQAIEAGQGLLSECPPAPSGVEVVLVIPPTDISWHAVSVPKVNPAKRQALLQGLLEEHLLTEPSLMQLSIAPWPADEAGRVWVSAFLREPVLHALQSLQQHGLLVSSLGPAWAPSAQPLAWAHERDGQACVSFSGPMGVLHAPLPMAGQTQRPWLSTADRVQGYASPGVLGLAESSLPDIAWQPQAPPGVFQRQRAQPWSLLPPGTILPGQRGFWGRLSTAIRQLMRAPQWAPLRWGLAGLLLVQALGWQLHVWQQQRQWAQLQQDTRALVTQAFPHIPLVLAPVQQMEREIERLQASAGQAAPQGLEAVLDLLGRVSGPQPPLQAIDYQNGQLQLTHAALSTAQRTAWERQLSSAGWALTTTPQGSQITWGANARSMP